VSSSADDESPHIILSIDAPTALKICAGDAKGLFKNICQTQTSAILFDHLVGGDEQRCGARREDSAVDPRHRRRSDRMTMLQGGANSAGSPEIFRLGAIRLACCHSSALATRHLRFTTGMKLVRDGSFFCRQNDPERASK